jgi:putative zinc finger/helix-turn-helix YgiT family protein
MICLKCENEDFVLRPDAAVEQKFRGETFNIRSPVMECKHCGWRVLAEGQMDELGRRTADAYREKHNLLTSKEIKGLRTARNMSQHEFAGFLEVGEASVKRWENWKVQDRSSDRLIRLKCGIAKQEPKPGITATSHQFNLTNQDTGGDISWNEIVTAVPQTVPVALSWQDFSGLAGSMGDYFSWVAHCPWTEISPWSQPKSATPLPDVSLCGSVQPRTFGGPSPPEECDASRFSFPMPSRDQKASEKKTRMIQCK